MRFTVSLAALVIAATVANAQQPTKDEQVLLQMERDWCEAALKADAVLLGRILADDFTGVAMFGVQRNKAQTLAALKASPASVCNDTDMKVRLYGDAAVVTGTGLRSGTFEGTPYKDRKMFWTDMFVRRNGQWQVVASQSTPAAATQK